MAESLLIRAKGIYDSRAGKISSADAVLVRNGNIVRTGSFETLSGLCPEAEILDWKRFFLFPGLVNTHVHLEFDETPDARVHYIAASPRKRLEAAAGHAHAMLGSGVTCARDAGSSWELLKLRTDPPAGRGALPLLQLAGPPLTVPGGHLHFLGGEVSGIPQMKEQARLRKEKGCDAVKLIVTGGQMTPGSLPERVSMTEEEIAAVCKESARLGLPTFAHCLTTEGFVRCMRGGVDCIEHAACFVRNERNGLLERVWEEERMRPFAGMPRYFMMGLSAGYHNLDGYREGRIPCGAKEEFLLLQEERMFDIFPRLISLGLTPVCGTDGGTSGTLFSDTALELLLMVRRGGMTVPQAVSVCTRSSAECLGIPSGSIGPGLRADLIALAEDPLEAPEAFLNVRGVVCGGKCAKAPEIPNT